jgi:hypothetical protein
MPGRLITRQICLQHSATYCSADATNGISQKLCSATMAEELIVLMLAGGGGAAITVLVQERAC